MGEYEDKNVCQKCGKTNRVEVVDRVDNIITECKTECAECGCKDYWSFGFFAGIEPEDLCMQEMREVLWW